MANSGKIQTATMYNKKIVFEWSVGNINNDARTGVVSWRLYCDCTKQYHLFQDVNYFRINGQTVWSQNTTYSSSGRTIYNGYCPPGNAILDGNEYYDRNGDYTGIVRWVRGWGNIASGSFVINYSEDGYASFSVDGYFNWYMSTNKQYLNSSFSLDRIETYSKIRRSTNSGGTWTKDRFIYKTTDHGATWKKCNLYKSTNNGNSWSRVS